MSKSIFKLAFCLLLPAVACDSVADGDPNACADKVADMGRTLLAANTQCDAHGLTGAAGACYNAAMLGFFTEMQDMAACPGYDVKLVCTGLQEAKLYAEYVANAQSDGVVTLSLNAAASRYARAHAADACGE